MRKHDPSAVAKCDRPPATADAVGERLDERLAESLDPLVAAWGRALVEHGECASSSSLRRKPAALASNGESASSRADDARHDHKHAAKK